MRKLNLFKHKDADTVKAGRWSTERISQTVLYVIIGVSALVFALFFLVGYNNPSVEEPSFNAPLLTDALLILMIVLLIIAAIIGFGAVIIGLRKRDSGDKTVNGVPAAKISFITFGVTFALLLLTFIFGSTDSMMINGHKFTDVVSLKLTDMFVQTSIVMIVLAIGAVIFGYTRYIRKGK